jgi:hypothetical protein
MLIIFIQCIFGQHSLIDPIGVASRRNTITHLLHSFASGRPITARCTATTAPIEAAPAQQRAEGLSGKQRLQ